MIMHNLRPCPFCGGEVAIAEKGSSKERCMYITRGVSRNKNNCKCRVFMESFPFLKVDDDAKEAARNDLIEAWNRRVNGGEAAISAYDKLIEKAVRRNLKDAENA